MSALTNQQVLLDKEIPTRQAIKRLIESVGGLRGSFYLQVDYTPQDVKKPAIELKNEIKAARGALEKRGVNDNEISSWLSPVQNLAQEPSLLCELPNSMALFIAEDRNVLMKIRQPVQNTLTISNRFFVKPLLPLLNDGGLIHLLVLDRGKTRMYRRGLNGLEPVKVPNMPQSIRQTSAFDDPEVSLQRHSTTSRPGKKGNGGQPGTMIHGQGGSKEYTSKLEHRFNHTVGTAVSKFLSENDQTLVIIGDEHNIGLLEQSLNLNGQRIFRHHANPSNYDENDLWELCSGIAQEIASEHIDETIEHLNSADQEQIITSPEEAAIAASHGLIRRCMVASDHEVIGVNIPEQQETYALNGIRGNDCAHDLLDIVAQETIRHGGDG